MSDSPSDRTGQDFTVQDFTVRDFTGLEMLANGLGCLLAYLAIAKLQR
ncbi:MAG: hypothetical protein AAF921_24425 [Cyanobacteria bacterium P01_D01_bin.44]